MAWFDENYNLHSPSQSFAENFNWINQGQYQEPTPTYPWSKASRTLHCSYCNSFDHAIQECSLRIAYEGPHQHPPPNPYLHSPNPISTTYPPYYEPSTPPPFQYPSFETSPQPPPPNPYDHSYNPYPASLPPYTNHLTPPYTQYHEPSYPPSNSSYELDHQFHESPYMQSEGFPICERQGMLQEVLNQINALSNALDKQTSTMMDQIEDKFHKQLKHFNKQEEQLTQRFPSMVNAMQQGLSIQEHLQLQEELPLTSGNIAPLFEEIIPPLSTTANVTIEATNCMSDDEVDEEIIVESPHESENLYAQLASSSSNCLTDDANCPSITPLCDKHASLPCTDHDDDISSNETLPNSCDNVLVTIHENCGELNNASFSIGSVVSIKHEIVKTCLNSKEIDECKHDLCLKNYFNLHEMHTVIQLVWDDSMFAQVKISKRNESYHLILSCDLPPDLPYFLDYRIILHKFFLHGFFPSPTLLLPTSSECQSDMVYSNPQLDSPSFIRNSFEHFENQNSSLISLAMSNFDFIGCEKQLLSNVPDSSLLTTNLFLCHIVCINSFHGFKYFDSCGILGVGTANFLVNYLQIDKRRLKLYFLLIFLSSYKPP